MRPLLAAILSLLTLLALGPPTGPFATFGPVIPALALVAGWLGRRLPPDLDAPVLGALLLAPAAGLAGWRANLARLDMTHQDPATAILDLLQRAPAHQQGLTASLAAAAVALWVLHPRRAPHLAAAGLGGALAAWLTPRLIITADARLETAPTDAASLILTASWLWLLAPLAALVPLAIRRPSLPPQHRTGALALAGLTVVLASWAARPPLLDLLAALPIPETTQAVPTALPAPGVSLPALDPSRLDEELAAAGLPREDHPDWSCPTPRARPWSQVARATVALALPASTSLEQLDALVETLRHRCVHRLALVGRAPPPPGPLGRLLAWPTRSLLLDAPPEHTTWGTLAPRGLSWERPPDGTSACALLPSHDLQVGQLYDALGTLHDDCTAVALVPAPQRPTAPSPQDMLSALERPCP